MNKRIAELFAATGQYLVNVGMWVAGFALLPTITYFPGWNWLKFLPVYLLNHGTRVLTGGPVVSWSRYLYDVSGEHRLAKFLTRLMNIVDDDHGEESGQSMWDTVACPVWFQVVLSLAWGWLIFG